MQPQKLKDKMEQPFKEATIKKLSTVVVKDKPLSELDFYVRTSEKYSFSLKETIKTDIVFGLQLATFVFESSPKTESTIRYCQYCGTPRDISKLPTCPKCGAS
jgi:hypothetical protein